MLWQRDDSTLVVTGSRAVLKRAVAGLVAGNRSKDRVVCTWDFMNLVHGAGVAGSEHTFPGFQPFRPVCVRSWPALLRLAQTADKKPVVLFARWSARSVFDAFKSPDVLVILVDQQSSLDRAGSQGADQRVQLARGHSAVEVGDGLRQ